MKDQNHEEARRWLSQAKADLKVARWDFEGGLCRYPNGLPALTPAEVFDREEAEQALDYAAKIVETVEQNTTSGESP